MRKIKVSGCLNCPYCMEQTHLTIDNKETVLNKICHHPSFVAQRATPTIPLQYITDLAGGIEYSMCPKEYMPNWCPLEYDGLVCISQPINAGKL